MRRLVPLTALLFVLAGGCGDDDDEPGRTVTADPGKAVHVVAEEYSFDPETIVLTGGGKLKLELENAGSLAHNLRVFDGATEIGGTPTFTGGETRSRHAERRARRIQARVHRGRPRLARDDGQADRQIEDRATGRRNPRPPRWRWWRP